MSRSRRTALHPPVLSTQAYAATEAALLGSAAATLTSPATETETDLVVPDSPANLWTSVGTRFEIDALDDVPAELRDWVAPAIVVHAGR